jgi:hypothetical protein
MRVLFGGMARGVSNASKGPKILAFLFRPRLACSSLLHLLRSYVASDFRGSAYILCEVSSQLAEMLRKTTNLSKKDPQTLQIHRGFIALC